ncbi:MAG: murein peptide amidase [Nocardioidaceae bacterium]|nr:murein peptide amidase [Nocardioidaceae bacterium]
MGFERRNVGRWVGLILAPALVFAATAAAVPDPEPETPVVKTIIRKKSIGKSANKRPILAWHLGDPQAKKTVVLISAIHGNEKAAATILRNLRDGKPIKGVNLWIIPVANPDGYAKNSRRNGRGVDLNRNFPVKWKKVGGYYNSGKKAASEPETRALMKFIEAKDPDYLINFHQPLYGADTSGSRSPKWAKNLRKGLKLPAKKFRCKSTCHGTFTMWFNKVQEGTTLTIELGAHPSKKYLTKTAPNALLKSFKATR